MAHLLIIRGLPGSGKSTLAKLLQSTDYVADEWYEAAMYFTNEDGEYLFDPQKIEKAHKWCFKKVCEALEKSDEPNCIVSNTFSRIWEMQPYLDYCKENNHRVTILTCEGNYGNKHNVPQETIKKMRERWENYVD